AQRIVLGQHQMHARRQHPVDLRDRARELLAERTDHPRPLLRRGGYEPAAAIEHLAESREFLPRQAVVVEDTHRLGKATVGDAHGDAAILAEHALGRDSVLHQHGDHLISLVLILIHIEVRLACRQQQQAHDRRNTSNRTAGKMARSRGRKHGLRVLMLGACPYDARVRVLIASVMPRRPRTISARSTAKALLRKTSPTMLLRHSLKPPSLPNRLTIRSSAAGSRVRGSAWPCVLPTLRTPASSTGASKLLRAGPGWTVEP